MLLLSKTLENRAALRTALAAITAILIAFTLHTDKPYWAGMTVVVVANLYTGSILDKAIDALLLTLQSLLVNGDVSVLPAMTRDNLQLKKSERKAQEMVGFMRHEVAYNRDIMERHRFLLDSCYHASRAIGYFLSSRKNLYEMHNISAFRLLGCILGGGVAFITLFFFPLNLYLFLLVIFLSVWAFSLFSFKQVTYAYIGLQANFALVIAMAQAGGPPLTIVPAMEQLGGVVIGIVASFLVANVLWRTNMLTLLHRQLNALHKRVYANLRYTLAADKQACQFYDLSSAFWICRGLLEAMAARKKQIEEMKDEHETLVFLYVTMNTILESVDQPRARKTGESLGIAVSSLENRVTALLDGHSGLGLRQDLHEALSVLMLTEDLRPQDRENCAAYLYALDQLVQHLLLGSEDSGFMPYKNAH